MSKQQNQGAIVITGGGRGIGAAVCRQAAKCGYRVVVNYERNEAAASEVVDSILDHGGEAISVRADVSVEEDVSAMFDTAQKEFGDIRALVCCAGIPGRRESIDNLTPEELRRVMDVNLYGPLLCAREAIRRMSRKRQGKGGGIIFMSSQAADTGGYLLAGYAAAKAALNTLSKALAREVGDEGIRVNAISPGVIATDQQPLDDNDWIEKVVSSIPIGRLGTPDDVASAALWLLSDEAAYISGTVIGVNGGR